MFSVGRRRWARAAGVGSIFVLVGAVGGAVASSEPSSSAGEHPGIFSAYIRSGPDRGLALWGVLSGKITAGKISGALKGDRPRVRLTGSVTGKKVTLVFHLPGGRLLTGVGTARTAITSFEGIPSKGTFSGPRRGDTGVWDHVVCTEVPNVRPGVNPKMLKCVTSEGKVFFVTLPAPSRT